ncbi:MAG TPA: hypothetical protein VFD32_11645 [Dehalococcoidia bacterium]|nr:hypothetical protein [Dehalococcoidia bacterium]
MEPYQTLDRLPWHRRLWFIVWNWTFVGPIGLSADCIETVEELQSLVEAIAGAVDEPSADADQHLAYLLAERAERLAAIYRNRLRVCFVLLWPLAAPCWLALTLKGSVPLPALALGWLVLAVAWLAGERWLVRSLSYQWDLHATLANNREREARIEARLRRSGNQSDNAARPNGA